MWRMKEWFFKFVLQTLWRRRKGLYHALSVVSIAGNLIVFISPFLQVSTVLRNIEALQAAWSALPQVAEVVLHRFVLYILLNLIVAGMVVKSGVLRQTAGMPLMMKQLDDFCLPMSSYSNSVRAGGVHWPPSTTDPCKPLPHLDRGDVSQMSLCSDGKPKRAPAAPSLFTIEPLDELVRSTEISSTSVCHGQAHSPKFLQHPLRKVASRAMDLDRSTEERRKGSENAERHQQQKLEEQSLQLVSASEDADPADDGDDGDDGDDPAEDADSRLSRQEFNERVNTFIVKFKRSLTMQQRQDSLTRLLGLVGGGGDIRLLK